MSLIKNGFLIVFLETPRTIRQKLLDQTIRKLFLAFFCIFSIFSSDIKMHTFEELETIRMWTDWKLELTNVDG